jgi:pimeloyl-ACP methyl ester carboxylesterase
MNSPSKPDTIVLIHGFWVTPRSWENWIPYYEAKGFKVLAPAYPGFEVEVEALNADPTPVADLTVPAIIDSLESVLATLDTPPILMGNSAAGAFTQVLLDHGLGAAGVVMNSAPTEGVRVSPAAQVRASLPVLKNPANHHKGGQSHIRAVALRVHQHHRRRRIPPPLRALRGSCVRTHLLGQRARELRAWAAGRARRLQEQRPRAPALHLR